MESLNKTSNATTTLLPPINQSMTLNNVNSQKNLSNVYVLTKTDLDRISNHLNRRQFEEDDRTAERQRKRELYERSKALTRNWNNTIEGSRRHKLEERKLREEKLEEVRKEIDLKHAEYMAEERKKAIEKAKLLQYYETDRIKTFHSALKLSEVLKEREAQIELKKVLAKLNREQDEEIERQNEKLLLEKGKIDESVYLKKKEEIKQLYEFNKKQIEYHVEKLKEKQYERIKEAEQLREENEKIQLENEQLEQLGQQKRKQLKETYDRILENRQKMREAQTIMDEEENEEIRVYAAAKKKMARIKYDKEREAQRKKEEHRERMLAYLGSLLKQQAEDEDFRIAKEVAKNEAKLLEQEQVKEKKLKEAIEQINKHRLDTIKRREDEERVQKKEDDELMKKKIEADLMYHVYEAEKAKKRADKEKHLSEANLKIAKERREADKQMKQSNREFVLKDLELLDLEDKQFEEYASKVIAYMEERNRNTYPMKRVLAESKRSNEQSESKLEGNAIKKHLNNISTKKNLGFS